eukprot:GFYU01001199.1.p2 GENE.GFYU01001199.1~~GFYU01001199.1.p2  ORF type:complete len:292 (+),score=91.11 GFYU01001199.1:394-1269(+)
MGGDINRNEAPAYAGHGYGSDIDIESYNFVYDMAAVRRFGKLFMVPEERYLIGILFKKKYAKDSGLRCKGSFFERRIFKGQDFERIVRMLNSIPVGCITDDYGKEIPREYLALYVTTNPRDMAAMNKAYLLETVKRSTEGAMEFDGVNEYRRQAQMHAKKRFMTLDVDEREAVGLARKIVAGTDLAPVAATETRSGYHFYFAQPASDLFRVYYDLKKILTAAAAAPADGVGAAKGKADKFAKMHAAARDVASTCADAGGDLERLDKIELLTDNMVPVPGTLQCGYPVTFVQ